MTNLLTQFLNVYKTMNDFAAFSQRDKAVLAGLFLSKFDRMALNEFGFAGFRQAYNVLGYALGVIPKSIQNYRDEFDPYFPNERKGWRGRALRDYCKEIMLLAQNIPFDDFCEIIKSFTVPNYEVEKFSLEKASSNRVANRLITGKAAEEYFMSKYTIIEAFRNYDMLNTTCLGCGFDFKLSLNADFYCVEVKGMNEKSGNILMTEKEYNVASVVKERYCLFVVRNFKESPEHTMYFNPLHNGLSFERQEKNVVQISYTTKL